MTRILVAAVPIPGHVGPLWRIANDLAGRGHDVTFVTGAQFRETARAGGPRFVALSGIAGFDTERQIEVFEGRRGLQPGPQQLDYDFIKMFYEPVAEQHATLQRVLAEAPEEPTVLITDQSFMGHWPVQLGAPGIKPAACIGIGVVPLSLNSVDTAPFGLALPPDSSAEGRARNIEQNRMVEAMFANSTGVLASILRDLGADTGKMPFPMDAVAALPDRFLELAIQGVEYPRSDLPPGVQFVGSLPAELPEDLSLPGWWGDVLAAHRVVVVTQGTLANRDLTQLIEPTTRALADLDALVVVTTGRADATLSVVPDNVRIVDFVPYAALLPHADLLVTNGGYGGCLQALAHGVPLVIAGQSEDKIEVSARLAWTGAAINLATDTPSESDVRSAVETIFKEPGYRARAMELRAESARHDAFDEIAQVVKDVMG
ncbi:nucleotide disphospho-sugar-binding domain-containing protein [Streptomyces sp. NBC_01497]|uniref:nucleotide disphospho-sugar-binding domain-containing protein n=1 Tax=Streptomyces sp. NBC_01497 TaxID=2903885 RepID=UPI002E351063|nr:nucleotide disphospho-sugar-binding domain-containing protein [Streptomyces sp. NBC_01497]